MVLPLDPDLLVAMNESATAKWSVQSFYGSAQTLAEVPVTGDGSITFDASGKIQANGSVYLAQTGGDSLVPKAMTDPLAPYGQELSINRVVTRGGITFPGVPLGRFRISQVPRAQEYFRRFPSLRKVVAWSAQLDLVDRFDIIDADDFLSVTAPIAGNSTYDELQRLSPIPIVRSLPDQPIPAGITYKGRFDAINQLISNLGGDPHMTRQGALTVRVKSPWLTATTPEFTINGVVSWEDGMSNDLSNSVVVTNPNNAAIVAVAEITNPADPLRVDGPLGRRVYPPVDDPLMDTQAKADAAAATILARVSTQQSRTVTITCPPRPDLELGDFGAVTDDVTGKTVTGSVAKMTFQMDATQPMSLDLTVAEVT